ncbi:MAG: hypothetical protein KC731_15540, partial [Myxococcales bacterium]|nr:hypothetical protein [Myxococcales bacterium]
MRWGLVAGALVGAASAGAAPLGCAEPSPDIAERSPAFRTEVEIARGDEPANLLDTDDAPCGPRHDGAGPASSLPSVGAALALTEVAGRRVALIADADAQQLRRLALDDAEELPATPLPGAPSALAIGEDGRIFVTLRDVHRVAVLEAGHDVDAPLELRCTRPTPREPVGLATYPGGLAVTSRWGQSLTLFDRDDTMKRQRVVGLPRDPQAVVVTEAGKAVVSHAFGGRLSLVDLKTGERRERKLTRREKMDGASVDHIDRIGNQAFVLVPLGQDDFALPNVMVDAGDNRTVASTAYYGGTAEVPIAVPLVARIDGRRDQVLVSTNNPARRCLLPKAATYDAAEDLVLVGCTGVDEVVALRRGKGRDRVHDELAWQAPLVGAPTALAVDAASHRLVAWSQFDATVTVVSLDRREERQVHRLTPAADLDPIIAA